MESTPVRTVRPWLALLLGILGPGVGYAYVGELRLAIISIFSIVAIDAVGAWTRLIVLNVAMFWLFVSVLVSLGLWIIVHPSIIAARNRQRPANWYNHWWFYLVLILLVYCLAQFLTRTRSTTLGFETFRTPSVAMDPSLHKGDYFMVDTWRYKDHKPAVGEIVVFRDPDGTDTKFVKRIVGVPGDRLNSQDGTLYRNGSAVSEPYLHSVADHFPQGRYFPELVIAPDQVFVMGDFRDNSKDSRHFGPIPISTLRGRVEYVPFGIDEHGIHLDRSSQYVRP